MVVGLPILGIMTVYERIARTSAEYVKKLYEVTEKFCLATEGTEIIKYD